ncbi:MAG: nucleotidyltransferase domain-containing protein [Candidatus Levybacteria bacterium]|nr:nucleotidyltransferase domain-containing protein [Candidatus Levybacteria bacterium]
MSPEHRTKRKIPDVEQTHLYIAGYHNKSRHSIYLTVPTILAALLTSIPSIDAFTLGGSYAKGTYEDGEDIDLDIIFNGGEWQTGWGSRRYRRVTAAFRRSGLTVDIRATIKSELLTPSERSHYYRMHSQSPFVARDSHVVEEWKLENDDF